MSEKYGPLPEPEHKADTDGCTYACPEGFSAAQMRAYAEQAVAAERERCAIVAWNHFMDNCKNIGVPPAQAGGWCAATSIRNA